MYATTERTRERTRNILEVPSQTEEMRDLGRHRISILGVRVDNVDGEAAHRAIGKAVFARKGTPMRKLFFVNVHTIHLARRNPEFFRCVNSADLILPDGSGLNLAGKLAGHPILENLNGTDFTPRVLREAEKRSWTVYLLGSKRDVLNRCRKHIEARFPRLNIVGDHPGYFSLRQERELMYDINRKRPDILLVALGSPLQELWIHRHAHELNVGVAMAVGGLFDFLSGERKRAPLWMRKIGIEWVFRFFQDPRTKWERVIVEIPIFLALVVARWCVESGSRLFPYRQRVLS